MAIRKKHRFVLTKFEKISTIIDGFSPASKDSKTVKVCPENPSLTIEAYTSLIEDVTLPIQLKNLKKDYNIKNYNGKHKLTILQYILKDGAARSSSKVNLQFESFDVLNIYLSQKPLKLSNPAKVNMDLVQASELETLLSYYTDVVEKKIQISQIKVTITRSEWFIMDSLSKLKIIELNSAYDMVLSHLLVRGLQKKVYCFQILKLLNIPGRIDALYTESSRFISKHLEGSLLSDKAELILCVIMDALLIQYLKKVCKTTMKMVNERREAALNQMPPNLTYHMDWKPHLG